MVAVVATQLVSPLLWDHYAVVLLRPDRLAALARRVVGAGDPDRHVAAARAVRAGRDLSDRVRRRVAGALHRSTAPSVSELTPADGSWSRRDALLAILPAIVIATLFLCAAWSTARPSTVRSSRSSATRSRTGRCRTGTSGITSHPASTSPTRWWASSADGRRVASRLAAVLGCRRSLRSWRCPILLIRVRSAPGRDRGGDARGPAAVRASNTSSWAAARRNWSGWHSRSSASGSWCRPIARAGSTSAVRSPGAAVLISVQFAPALLAAIVVAGSRAVWAPGAHGRPSIVGAAIVPLMSLAGSPPPVRLPDMLEQVVTYNRAYLATNQQYRASGLVWAGGDALFLLPLVVAALARAARVPPRPRRDKAGDRGDRLAGRRDRPRGRPGPLLRPLPDRPGAAR